MHIENRAISKAKLISSSALTSLTDDWQERAADKDLSEYSGGGERRSKKLHTEEESDVQKWHQEVCPQTSAVFTSKAENLA